MTKLRCILADDEPLALRLLENYVARTESLQLVGKFSSAPRALEAIKEGNVELAFLDIHMPGMTGMDLARAAMDTGIKVVFITAYKEYALEGFRVNALDYLLKPVAYDEFLGAVKRAEAYYENTPEPLAEESQYISVRSDYQLVKINFDDILYVEGLKDYVKIYTVNRDRPVLTQMSMKAMEQALPHTNFMRVHRSYVINLDKIEAYGRTQASIGTAQIPVSDTYKAQFLQRMA